MGNPKAKDTCNKSTPEALVDEHLPFKQTKRARYPTGVPKLYFTLVSDFDTLVAPHRQTLLAFAIKSYRGDIDKAEDAVQDTMLRAYQAWSKYDGASLTSWLHRILINVISTSLRTKKHGYTTRPKDGRTFGKDVTESIITEDFQMMSSEPSPLDMAIANELGTQLETLIAELSDAHREALEAFMKNAPMTTTMRTRLFRARTIIKNKLNAPVMQLADISVSKTGSCGFESHSEYQN